MLKCCTSILAVMFLASGIICAAVTTKPAGNAPSPARIGTYDPRAIAVAWAHSKMHNEILKSKMDELDKAKRANDQKKVSELEAWGKAQQAKLHLQGFSGANVEDIMARVKDQLPAAAQSAGVDVIVGKPDYAAAGVKTVDMTDELVKIFHPQEKTLKIIQDLRKHDPVPVEQLEKMDAHD